MSKATALSKKRSGTTAVLAIEAELASAKIALLPAIDVERSLDLAVQLKLSPKVVMLDPWYNKGYGGVRDDYTGYISNLLEKAAALGEHVFLWGFPEIIARFVDKIPKPLELVCWLTWYYKNNPSVIRGWRSSQNACLHLARPGTKLYPEHFMNERQHELQLEGKLRYMPGPTSVIEVPLNVGFVGKKERTGHPSQKPVAVFERLILMATKPGDCIFDPMCGSGTTGDAARMHGRLSILSDSSEEYVEMCEKRLGIKRLESIGPELIGAMQAS